MSKDKYQDFIALWQQLSGEERAKLSQDLKLDQEITEVYACPFDCDSCHDEDCPCDRFGCAGYDD